MSLRDGSFIRLLVVHDIFNNQFTKVGKVKIPKLYKLSLCEFFFQEQILAELSIKKKSKKKKQNK